MVSPGVAGTSIQEHGDEKEVNESLGNLLLIGRVGRGLPLLDEGADAGAACVEVPPATMRRDLADKSHMVINT